MSRVPKGSDNGGGDGNNLRLREKVFQASQGISADLIATIEGLRREDGDRFALESQRRAAYAQAHGYFKSIFPIRDPESGKILWDRDEHVRSHTT